MILNKRGYANSSHKDTKLLCIVTFKVALITTHKVTIASNIKKISRLVLMKPVIPLVTQPCRFKKENTKTHQGKKVLKSIEK